VFYINRDRLPDFCPPFLGWNSSAQHGGWEKPTEFTLQPSAHQFQPGNAGFISVSISFSREMPVSSASIS